MLAFFIENSTSNIPTLIHSVGVGLISIFLTAIIFIYTATQKEMQDWDRVIILEKVVNVRDFFVYLSLLFIPPFFWGFSDTVNLMILIIFIISVLFLFQQLKNIYNWIKDIEPEGAHLKVSYRQKLREDFLSEKDNTEYKTKIWSLTWSQKNINSLTERRLIKIFFEQAKNMAENADWENLRDWLHYFNTNRDNREFRDWVSTETVVSNMLKINYIEFKELTDRNNTDHKHIYSANLINDLLVFFVSNSLSNGSAFILFKTLKEHIEDKDKDKEYQNYLIGKIYRTLFETIPSIDLNYDIWRHYFPPEWKVTEENLKKNNVAFLFFKFYIEWLKEKIGFEKEWKKELDEISRELFPSVSPSLWSEIVTYVVRPFGKNRGEDLFKNPPNFGFMGHIFSGDFTSEEDMQKHLQQTVSEQNSNAISLAVKYFVSRFMSKEEIQKTVKQLENIEPENKDETYRKEKLLQTFNDLLQKIEEIENDNSKEKS